MDAGRSLWRRLDESGIPLLIARLVVGGLFVWMGYKKVLEPIEFLKQIRMYHALPESPPYFLNLTAVVLPWLEMVAGAALIIGCCVRGAGAIAAIMLAVFTPAILLRTLGVHADTGTPFFQIQFDCGCGAGVVVAWKKLLENSTLFLLALIALFSQTRRFCAAQLAERRRARPLF